MPRILQNWRLGMGGTPCAQPVDAAAQLGRRLGLGVDTPVVLRATNNVVVWLSPSPVVAKVSSGDRGRLGDELTVARYLVERGAPVVAPAPGLPQVVHRYGEFDVTLWTYHPQEGRNAPSATSVAMALHALHDALAEYPDRATRAIPPYSLELTEVRARLDDPSFARMLAPDDRQLLWTVLDTLPAELESRSPSRRVLHGSPHRLNVLTVDDDPRFIDFETICSGPPEWDLAHLEAEVADAYPGEIDSDCMSMARTLVSAKTAAWCWDGLDTGPDMRRHAEHHLRQVRQAAGGGRGG